MKEKQKTEPAVGWLCFLFAVVFSLRTVSLGSMQDASNRRRLVFCLKNA